MAEFKKVMLKYAQMCDSFRDGDYWHCEKCPIGKNESLPCLPANNLSDDELEIWEATVMNWNELKYE